MSTDEITDRTSKLDTQSDGIINLSIGVSVSSAWIEAGSVVDVSGSLLAFTSDTTVEGFAGMSSDSIVCVVVSDDGSASFSDNNPLWSSSNNGLYVGQDRAVAWVSIDVAGEISRFCVIASNDPNEYSSFKIIAGQQIPDVDSVDATIEAAVIDNVAIPNAAVNGEPIGSPVPHFTGNFLGSNQVDIGDGFILNAGKKLECRLNGSVFAAIYPVNSGDGTFDDPLVAVKWDGSSFSKIGNVYNLSGAYGPMCNLSDNVIAIISDGNSVLQRFTWDGSSFSLSGSSSVTSSFTAIARISDNEVVVITGGSGNTKFLIVYEFSGGSWSQVGNAMSLGTTDSLGMDLTSLKDNVVVLFDNTSIQTYSWDGSDFASYGSSYTSIDTDSNVHLGGIDDKNVGLTYEDSFGTSHFAIIHFNGSSWSEFPDGLTTAVSSMLLSDTLLVINGAAGSRYYTACSLEYFVSNDDSVI